MTDEQLAELNEALKLCAEPKDKSYRPYCLCCSSMDRMELKPYGFKCRKCRNPIGFDLKPLNDDLVDCPHCKGTGKAPHDDGTPSHRECQCCNGEKQMTKKRRAIILKVRNDLSQRIRERGITF